jgi:hypothetical protein
MEVGDGDEQDLFVAADLVDHAVGKPVRPAPADVLAEV